MWKYRRTNIKLGPSSNSYINVLDIREDSIEDEKGYLATKLSKLRGFFSLVFGDLNEEKNAILEEALIKMYKEKGITFEDDSLYKISINNKKTFKEPLEMPILEDLYISDKDNETIYLFNGSAVAYIHNESIYSSFSSLVSGKVSIPHQLL